MTQGMLAVVARKRVAGGGGGFAFIAEASERSSNGNDATTGAIDTTGADLLVATIVDYTGATASTFSDSKGNTWNVLTESTSSNTRTRLAWSVPSSVGSGHTFTTSGSGSFPAVGIMAFSGGHASPFDQQNGNGGIGTSIATGSITPSEDNELVVSGLGFQDVITSLDISGYTKGTEVGYAGGSFGLCMAYKIQTSASAENPSWTWGNSTLAATRIASFKAA